MKRIIPLILLIGFIATSCRDTSKAPKDFEAHLGLGLSYTCLGYYAQAHSEFSLIYSPYVAPQAWDLNLYVDASYRDTIGNTYVASPTAQFVSRYGIIFSSPSLRIIGGQWRLGKILRENNVFLSDENYLYLITEYNEIKVKPKGSYERLITGEDIYGYTDGLAYVDSFIAVDGKLTLIDTIGPVLFVSSKRSGIDTILRKDTSYIHSWLKHNDSVFVEMKVTAFRVPRRGLDNISWLALAADAYAYYVEGTNLEKAASLALIAYWTRNLIYSFPSRLQNIPGLSDRNEKKGLAAVYAQANYKRGMLAGSVSMIRVFDTTWPAGWTYTARSRAEIDTAVKWMRHEPKFRALGIKIDSVFYRR
jgi:hypothetical protein